MLSSHRLTGLTSRSLVGFSRILRTLTLSLVGSLTAHTKACVSRR